MELQRISDSDYVFTTKDNKTVSITVSSKVKDSAFKHHLAEKAAEIILKQNINQNSGKKFRLGNKKWRLLSKNKTSFILKFLSFIFPFIHKAGKDGISRYEVKSTLFGKSKTKKILTPEKADLKKNLKSAIDRTNYKHYLAEIKKPSSQKRLSEFKQLIRGKERLSADVLDFKSQFFDDPFTKLSAKAFQIYEKEFTSKDYFAPEFCDYRLIKNKNKLLLVHKKSPLVTKQNSQEAIKIYREFLLSHFGKEKIDYIQHLFRFNLDKIDTLTPEHIYRMNVGLSNAEVQELDAFYAKLPELDRDLANQNPDSSLEDYLRQSKILTGQEAKGLFRFLNDTHAETVNDIQNWITSLKPFQKNTQHLTPQQINDLVGIISFNEGERDLALTGRRIFGFIRSGYTTAGYDEYKPWVDQHQMTQIFSELINAPSQEAYQELLSHVIVKLHHAKEHPTEGFRIGALLPAPPAIVNGVKGPIRWYKITSCISNGYGMFCFTLESVGNDPSLPSIVVYRSTARCSYALHSKASIINDLNNFNSPGHQGMGRTDQYEKEFFNNRTWPVWMAYNYLAGQKFAANDDPKTIFDLLSKSNETLLDEFENTYKRKSFEEILKSYDTILNDLLFDFLFSRKKKSNFLTILKYIIKTYIIAPANQLFIHSGSHRELTKEKRDALKLTKELMKIMKHEKSPKMREEIALVIRDINEHILTERYKAKADQAREVFKKEIYNSLTEMQKHAEAELKNNNIEEAKQQLNLWAQAINAHGSKLGEDLNSKIDSDLVFSGHSLGGASAQSHIVHWTTAKGRIPLPNKACTAYCFDDPAINIASNRQFKDFGNRHAELLNALGIKFGIVRRQEAGDFTPTAGEEHLGAADDLEEEKLLNRWLRSDYAVFQKSSRSTHAPIALAKIAHETRALAGKKKQTFYKRSELLNLKAEWESKKHLPESQAALREINDRLNKAQDFKMTHYTSHIQKIFDTQGACCSKNHLPDEEIFGKINREIWHIPYVFKPRNSESWRKSVSFFFMFIRKWAASSHDNYPLEEKYLDRRGNFVVSAAHGVMTRS